MRNRKGRKTGKRRIEKMSEIKEEMKGTVRRDRRGGGGGGGRRKEVDQATAKEIPLQLDRFS